MKTGQPLIALLILILGSISCSPIWLRFSGVLEEEPELKVLSNAEKEVLFLPIHHIGRESYYRAVKRISDSLDQQAYTILYEQVSTDLREVEDFVVMAKKFRKLTGSFDAGTGYLDTVNHKIGSMHYNPKYQLMNQPDLVGLGIDTATAIKADLLLEDLILAFEKKNGTIQLDSCDLDTDLESDYLCSASNADWQKDFRKNFILGLRNENLARHIDQSESEKIFVIYGASHFKGLKKELSHLNLEWTELK
ncbi:hypothetical protein [Croceimicrobium hydrocarbonivorans]|uniref:TraB/GumN family protein n=1 Tax=Croceimicrobium hydrocarbonivorans TaxID=2761580 RepID=A0A7H0VH36_9FLAO|nr:hypothetical protein [Croceimicrobium hydrocarbonivorans]QNR25034.1 hypothetical protein H4K34_04085 [Croceimicrobium hydrocarbonivorans]